MTINSLFFRLLKRLAVCLASAVRLRWSAAQQRRGERRLAREQTLLCWTTLTLRLIIYRGGFKFKNFFFFSRFIACFLFWYCFPAPGNTAPPCIWFLKQDLHVAAGALKREFPSLQIEASGGVATENLPMYFSPHVDIISLGCITQGCPVVDFSLKVQKPVADSTRQEWQTTPVETDAAVSIPLLFEADSVSLKMVSYTQVLQKSLPLKMF